MERRRNESREPSLKERWSQRAHGWDRWEPILMHALSPVDPVLMRALELRPGQRIVDFGCGTGEPTLSIARWVGPRGSALGIDLAAPMLAIARQRARRLGLSNVRFGRGDMASYRHPGPRFDGAVSRFGLMFAPDVAGALACMRSCLKPGGRIAVAVWGTAKENPGSVMRAEITRPFMKEEPPDPEQSPHPLRLGRAGLLPRLMRGAGFRRVAVEPVRMWSVYPGIELATQVQIETALADLFARLSPADREKLVRSLRHRLTGFLEDGIVRVPALAWVGWGIR